MTKGELFFSSYDFFNASYIALQSIKKAAAEVPERALTDASNEEIVAGLVEEYSFGKIEIQWDLAKVRREEVMVDLMYAPNTMAYFEQRSVMRPGESYIISVPFVGEESYLKLRPSQFSLTPPRGEITRSALKFAYEGLTVDVENSKKQFENTKRDIEIYLGWLRSDFENHNSKLTGLALPILEAKRERMIRGEQRLSGFGLPVG